VDSETGKAGSPYYIGVASRAHRPYSLDHGRVAVPDDERRIRILRSGITYEQALQWEQFFIEKFGRKDTGTGRALLVNRTRGGEGAVGRIKSDEERARHSANKKGRSLSKQHREAISRGLAGIEREPHSEETRARISAGRMGMKLSASHRRAISEGQRGRKFSPTHCARLSEVQKGKHIPVETRERMRQAKRLTIAARLGISVDLVEGLTQRQRDNLLRRFRSGKRGAELFYGILPALAA